MTGKASEEFADILATLSDKVPDDDTTPSSIFLEEEDADSSDKGEGEEFVHEFNGTKIVGKDAKDLQQKIEKAWRSYEDGMNATITQKSMLASQAIEQILAKQAASPEVRTEKAIASDLKKIEDILADPDAAVETINKALDAINKLTAENSAIKTELSETRKTSEKVTQDSEKAKAISKFKQLAPSATDEQVEEYMKLMYTDPLKFAADFHNIKNNPQATTTKQRVTTLQGGSAATGTEAKAAQKQLADPAFIRDSTPRQYAQAYAKAYGMKLRIPSDDE